jgi:putative RNA 2'-phosphotransferase
MEYTDKQLINKGRHLAFLLRHDKDAFDSGLIDQNGWRSVKELMKQGYTLDLIKTIVETNDKKRYEFSQDGSKIRARQGHSIPVDVELQEMEPPEILYHGTGEKYVESIDKQGLLPKSRLYVHLSSDEDTAKKVGSRHGKPVIYIVKSGEMYRNHEKFYLSVNGVWLTKCVPVQYLSKM